MASFKKYMNQTTNNRSCQGNSFETCENYASGHTCCWTGTQCVPMSPNGDCRSMKMNQHQTYSSGNNSSGNGATIPDFRGNTNRDGCECFDTEWYAQSQFAGWFGFGGECLPVSVSACTGVEQINGGVCCFDMINPQTNTYCWPYIIWYDWQGNPDDCMGDEPPPPPPGNGGKKKNRPHQTMSAGPGPGIVGRNSQTRNNQMINNVHPLVMNWLSTQQSMDGMVSGAPDWSMWANTPINQSSFSTLTQMINNTSMMKSRVERINNNRNLNWKQKLESIESMLQNNGQINRELTSLRNSLTSQMNQANQQSDRWQFGIKCKGCAWDEACCWIVAACIVLMILL